MEPTGRDLTSFAGAAGASSWASLALSSALTLALAALSLSLSAVLSIHKRPLAAHGDINFPMKGWRGMVDWARSAEDRVTLPKNIVSTEQTGEQAHGLALLHASHTLGAC